MSIVLPALAVAFAAFCLWLGVRIINRREQWAKRTAVGIVTGLPLLYVLSFVPARWLVDRGWIADRPPATVYRPIVLLISKSEIADDVAVALCSLAGKDPTFTIDRLEKAAGLPRRRSGFWPADPQHDTPHPSDAW